MKKNHSKDRATQATSQRVVEPEAEKLESAPSPERLWKPITLEDLNLTIEQMEVYAAACRPIFAPRTWEEDEESQSTDAQNGKEPRP